MCDAHHERLQVWKIFVVSCFRGFVLHNLPMSQFKPLTVALGAFAILTTTAHAQKSGAWKSLFDGKSLAAWKGYRSDAVPAGWRIENNELTKSAPVGDLITRDQFGDFELELEWKIGRAGNSGIFYRGIEDPDYVAKPGEDGKPVEDRLYMTGPEYQLLDDDEARDNKTRLTCAAAAYGLYPSPAGHLKPVGDWNKARILARGAHVEHWLNDVKMVEYELWSPDWEAKVKATKFNAWPKFGRARRGHIGLQGDHEGSLAFRNIRIREVQ